MVRSGWMQDAKGYKMTILNGVPTFEDGKPTGALTGKLVPHPLRQHLKECLRLIDDIDPSELAGCVTTATFTLTLYALHAAPYAALGTARYAAPCCTMLHHAAMTSSLQASRTLSKTASKGLLWATTRGAPSRSSVLAAT